jgi:hypothetical protein
VRRAPHVASVGSPLNGRLLLAISTHSRACGGELNHVPAGALRGDSARKEGGVGILSVHVRDSQASSATIPKTLVDIQGSRLRAATRSNGRLEGESRGIPGAGRRVHADTPASSTRDR